MKHLLPKFDALDAEVTALVEGLTGIPVEESASKRAKQIVAVCTLRIAGMLVRKAKEAVE